MTTLNRQDFPPKPGPKLQLWRIEAGSGFVGQIVSQNLWGVWTHWDGYRSRECTAKKLGVGESTDEKKAVDVEVTQSMQAPEMQHQGCKGHLAKWPLRWKGYLYVWNGQANDFGFLELTPGAATELLRQAPSSGILRGLLLRANRNGKSIRTKCSIELSPSAGGFDKLPPPVDPEDTLRSLWGWANKS